MSVAPHTTLNPWRSPIGSTDAGHQSSAHLSAEDLAHLRHDLQIRRKKLMEGITELQNGANEAPESGDEADGAVKALCR